MVVFDADDGPLVPGDNNHEADVFAVEMSSKTVHLVSARHPVLPSVSGNLANSAPFPALSADGQRAVFLSWSDNLVPGDTNLTQDIFAFDVARQRVSLVSATPSGTSSMAGGDRFVVSADGHVVVFASSATDLVSTPVTNSAVNLFWRDLDQAKTQLLTVGYDGRAASSGTVDSPVSGSATVNQDGQRVAFISSATNLVQAATPPGSLNLLFRDMATQTTRLVDQGYVAAPVLSPDGTRLLYWKHPGQNSPAPPARLMLWDAASRTNRVVVEVADAGVGQVSPVSMSTAGDGGVFEVRGTNANRVEWVHLADGIMKSVTQVSDGVETTNATPTLPAISGDGSSVLFTSSEARYPGGINGGFQNVFVRNLQTGALTLVSASQKGPAGDGDSRNAAISQDGRYVVFQSDADNLVPNDTNQVADVFLRDLVEKSTP